jgi:hypothetical protein
MISLCWQMVKRLTASNFKQPKLPEVRPMEQNSPKDPKIIKITAEMLRKVVPSGVTPGESFSTTPCYIVSPVSLPLLEKPIPIPKSRKKKRK